jgi:catechol 2,3-dioxygenase
LFTNTEIIASPHLHQDGDVLRGTDPTGVQVTLRPIT